MAPPQRPLPPLAMVLAALAAGAALGPAPAAACTRALFTGENNTVITGRTLDWLDDSYPGMWAMPRGANRSGNAGPNSLSWTSKYGSVAVSMYNIATIDGMNEKGLVGNVLYLAESDYGQPNGKPAISIALWMQYVLDNFATVKEAVTALRPEPFRIVTVTLPNGKAGSGHLALSDASGDSAIFEYIKGKLVIHHGRQYRVMTNSPPYDQQLAVETYWRGVGGAAFLPGTVRAADRFVRATWFLNNLPAGPDPKTISAVPGRSFQWQAMMQVRSLMAAVSVPLGIADPREPNIASTYWRTVSDQKDRIYAYDSTTSPNAFWVKLSDLDLSSGAPVRQLPIAGGRVYAGNVAKQFAPAQLFKFAGPAGV